MINKYHVTMKRIERKEDQIYAATAVARKQLVQLTCFYPLQSVVWPGGGV